MAQETELSDQAKLPPLYRKVPAYLTAAQLGKLDKEALRRKVAGEDIDPESGQRINVNRSTILREIIDEKFPD